jgi:hypothetical protein
MLTQKTKPFAILGILFSILLISACKWVTVTVTPTDPKQGDLLTFEITAGDASDLDRIVYSIGSLSGTIYSVPHTLNLNSCKTTGTYHSAVNINVTAHYDDGSTRSYTENVDLTVGKNSREDTDQTYVLYIADEGDGKINDIRSAWANQFQDEFDAYSQTQYLWAHPSYFTTHASSYANSADMAIFLGHGSPHEYRAGPNGSDWVDFQNTAFGNMAECNNSGDAEYLVSGACQLLSMNNINGHPYRYFWSHEHATRLNSRAFSGLHQICGFRTNHSYNYWWWGRWRSSSEDFFENFASRLDSGDEVRDAWLTAAGDKLSFSGGNNRAAVLYIWPSVDDQITTVRDDHIYGNANYGFTMEYWE